MNKVKQDTMVPYESIDPTSAGALRPGVSFLVSNKTIAELIVEKGLGPSQVSARANASSANGPKISKDEAMHICALADGETTAADTELALGALQTPDGNQAWEIYHRIGDVLRNYGPPEISRDFDVLLAARLDKEAPIGQSSSVTRETKPPVVVPPLPERTRES
jgi:sigma-E factor negative regulatory protein RseA